MPKIKAHDLAYVRFGVPDLDEAEVFLNDFGLNRSAETATARYYRARDDHHHVYITEQGETRFKAMAFEVASEAALETFAAAEGLRMEAIAEPGGGKRVLLTEPNGYTVELVAGIERVAPIPTTARDPNVAAVPLRRAGDCVRLEKGPARVRRLGHVVLSSPRPYETVAWFRETLGLLGSDDLHDPDNGDRLVGSFNRLDRGEEFVDHHVFFCLNADRAGFNHVAFEVEDLDEVFLGHDYLRDRSYELMWGIGRHYLGSQVFDYWADPWGRMHEHWSDSDRLNASTPKGVVGREGMSSQWGAQPNPAFFDRISP
jgi:catechol 2,3-dioxygenase-like lactoylglutathione lyase family enzyme